jgi:hypothetical protein
MVRQAACGDRSSHAELWRGLTRKLNAQRATAGKVAQDLEKNLKDIDANTHGTADWLSAKKN